MTRLAALALVAIVVVGCGGSDGEPDGDPGVFMTQLVRAIGANRYDEAWEWLHPAHQQVAPRAEYVACERQNPVTGRVSEVVVVSVKDASVNVAGESKRASGKAVRVRLSVRQGEIPEPERLMQTFHTVPVEREWRWILNRTRYDAYRADRCP